jgi:GDP-fucose protein O-fucosyltransferase
LILEDAAKLASEAMASEVDTRGDPERAADTVVMEKGRDKVQTLEMANEHTGGGNTNFGAVYHAAHIRRGDFQYDQALIGADEIYRNIHLLFNRSVSTLLYISTDEGNKTFFEPFHKHFTVRFLADFMEPAKIGASHLNQNHIGMVEQTICANAHTFVGTPWSTFTGYITRMRGKLLLGRIV